MIAPRHVNVGTITIGNDLPFTLIAGPCVMESRQQALEISQSLVETCAKHNVSLIFKASFDKANRTSSESQRGIGIAQTLPILEEIRDSFGCPILTDVHTIEQCDLVSKVIDVIQIPAFLCRQTDLIVAAAKTGRVLNIKKGQFLAPWDMKNVVAKSVAVGNKNVMVCERGVSFGYNTLISDMRAIPILAEGGYPVVFDATHSVQQPGGRGTSSDGQREFVPILARAAVAVGVAALFVETHPDPDVAPSDGPNMLPLNKIDEFLRLLKAFDQLVKK
ncbi:MAG: 3-deoxy-8-phosphooctulonate synthase [Rhodospirillaceae bacterium]|nr:3-deoxy-8-phosphooctulonate synthase [Rhodospirillaceae bacterium]